MYFDDQEYTAGLRDVNEMQRDTAVSLAQFSTDNFSLDLSAAIQSIATKKRSPKWRALREAHLKEYPRCEACGDDKNLEVHHVQPYHLFPELELVKSNLMTLCCHGIGGMNCHLVIGHTGNWSSYSSDPVTAAYQFREMMKRRKP